MRLIYLYVDEWQVFECYAVDDSGNQIGSAGYGPTKRQAKSDWKYQQLRKE